MISKCFTCWLGLGIVTYNLWVVFPVAGIATGHNWIECCFAHAVLSAELAELTKPFATAGEGLSCLGRNDICMLLQQGAGVLLDNILEVLAGCCEGIQRI